jgi:hypothetical protein
MIEVDDLSCIMLGMNVVDGWRESVPLEPSFSCEGRYLL